VDAILGTQVWLRRRCTRSGRERGSRGETQPAAWRRKRWLPGCLAQVHVRINIPKQLDTEERQLVEQLRDMQKEKAAAGGWKAPWRK